ncbi:MAG: acyl-ACP--UDP-N-acetylglucosamine O-acyltransferase [Myxococcota bacterium]
MAIHPTAIVDPRAELGRDVEVEAYSIIRGGVVLHDGVRIGPHAVITGPTVIGEGSRVFPFASIGEDPQDLKYKGETTRLEIGARNTFREGVTINRGTGHGGGVTRIGSDNLFMAGSHVAHDSVVGNHCVFANCAAIAGHVTVQDRAILGGFAGVHQHSRIGRCAMVGAGAMAAQDVPPFTIAQGDRARLFGLNIVGLRRAGFKLEVLQALKAAYRELFHEGRPMRIALEQVREVYADMPEVVELVDFCEDSQRGICRSTGTEQPQE